MVISFKILNCDLMVTRTLSKNVQQNLTFSKIVFKYPPPWPHIIFARFYVCVFFLIVLDDSIWPQDILKSVNKKSKPRDSWKICY